MMCTMQNHTIQAFANSGNAIKPLSIIRDLKSKEGLFLPPPITNVGAELLGLVSCFGKQFH